MVEWEVEEAGRGGGGGKGIGKGGGGGNPGGPDGMACNVQTLVRFGEASSALAAAKAVHGRHARRPLGSELSAWSRELFCC